MTLITRISNRSKAFIASDDKLSFNDGTTEVINKSFFTENLIGAASGFLVDKKLGFSLMHLLSGVQNTSDITEILENQIPSEKLYEKVCILFSILEENKVNDFILIRKCGKVGFREKQQKPLFNIKVHELISKDYIGINESFDREFYTECVDFNFNYEDVYDYFFHSIFHICAYNIFGTKSTVSLLERDDIEIIQFMISFYEYINGICYDNLGEYYRRDYSNSLKTIGKCNSIMKLDIETGVTILYQ